MKEFNIIQTSKISRILRDYHALFPKHAFTDTLSNFEYSSRIFSKREKNLYLTSLTPFSMSTFIIDVIIDYFPRLIHMRLLFSLIKMAKV